jgi:hypothetical protein
MYLESPHHNKFTIRAVQVQCYSVSDVEALDQGGGSAPPLLAVPTKPKRIYQNVWLQDCSRQVKSWSFANVDSG